MPQIHLRAEEGDYAPLVLIPGDPNRARRISERFDPGSARQVNDHRGLLGFTGTYRGTAVSVQTSGMGTPSLSIVVEELSRIDGSVGITMWAHNSLCTNHITLFGSDDRLRRRRAGAGEGIRTLDPNLGKVVLYP